MTDQELIAPELPEQKDPTISGSIKMKVLDRFNEKIAPLNKINFLKVLLKYKTVNSFGDINDWLKITFSNIITD